MFQRGLFELNTLDTSYVSSVSWYFLVMFGLRAFFRLAIGDPMQEETEGHHIQKELGKDFAPGAPGNQFDGPKSLRAEADNLELLNARQRVFHVDDAEKKLLGKRYPRKKVCKKKSSSGEDVLFGFGGKSSSSTQTSRKKSRSSTTPDLTKDD